MTALIEDVQEYLDDALKPHLTRANFELGMHRLLYGGPSLTAGDFRQIVRGLLGIKAGAPAEEVAHG